MSLRCGIVGLPNVGKSTIFNALTDARIAAENYPFCTVEPNTGVVPVPDPRLDTLAKVSGSEKIVPATVEFVDIAGLVRGASQGEGLGNQFLAHIRETDAIAHVVRCFHDSNVTHVDGDVDSLRDLEVIETELGLADLQTMERRVERMTKTAKGNKDQRPALEFLEGLFAHLGDGKPARTFPVSEEQRETYRDCYLLTAKPILYVANVDESSLTGDDPLVAAVENHANQVGAEVVRLCGKVEAELCELDTEERSDFLHELGLEEPGLDRLVHAAYRLLGLITFLTTGPNETRAWDIPAGRSAQQAAGEIHSDFERNFIRAEVTDFDEFIAAGGEVEAKAQGKTRIEGKDYIVKDGDVILFRTGA